MSTRDALAALAALALTLAGCAADTVPAIPPGWLPVASDRAASRGGYGAWVDVSHGMPFQRQHVVGELIACDRDSTWVLTKAGLVAVPNRRAMVRLSTGVDARGQVIRQPLARVRASELRPWSRFPQGLSAGVDRTQLKPKP